MMLQTVKHRSLNATASAREVRGDDGRSAAIVFKGEAAVGVEALDLIEPSDKDVVVDVHWSGVSTGTERLLWRGDMPPFPGLAYPLVPGYEAVGVVARSEGDSSLIGRSVFVPGAHCFKRVQSVFGASASRLIAPRDRVAVLDAAPQEDDVLLALAATAYHAVAKCGPPELIVGHGVLGRLIARIAVGLGAPPPTVWECDTARLGDADYPVMAAEADPRTDYHVSCDASGDPRVIDEIIARSARNGRVVLAGFYAERPSFAFAPAFMREASLHIAAEWTRTDLDAVLAMRRDGRLSLAGLVTHTAAAADAFGAYQTAFEDPGCLKMALDWRSCHDHAY